MEEGDRVGDKALADGVTERDGESVASAVRLPVALAVAGVPVEVLEYVGVAVDTALTEVDDIDIVGLPMLLAEGTMEVLAGEMLAEGDTEVLAEVIVEVAS